MEENTPSQNPEAAGDNNGKTEDQGPAPDKGAPSDVSAELRRTKRELKQVQTQLSQLKTADEERKEAELTAAEREKNRADKAEQKATELEAKLSDTRKRNAFNLAAQAANVRNVDHAWKLADVTSLEVKDDGTVEGVADALKALRKDAPYCFGSDTPKPPTGGNPKSGPPSGELTPEQILSMPSEDYQKRIARFRAQQ